MATSPTPIFFPEIRRSFEHWTEFGKTHGLTQKDLEWLRHVQWATHVLRNRQTPPMHAEHILVGTGSLSKPLAGCFVLSTLPDAKGIVLYTPYTGIKKFTSRSGLAAHIKTQLDNADEDNDLLAFMSLAARKTLAEATDITVSFETIEDDIFQDQRTIIEDNLRSNDQAMLYELQKLPTLDTLLDTMLDDWLKADFPALDQRQTQVNFYTEPATSTHGLTSSKSPLWTRSFSLRETVLWFYRHQRWPIGQHAEFSHPRLAPLPSDQTIWQAAVKQVADNLISHLSAQLQQFWNQASVDGTTRRAFFSRAIGEKARADLLFKREDEILSPEQSRALHPLIEPVTGTSSTLTLETVRLFEYPPNYIELAGSLMISQSDSHAFLYTPAQGFEVLKNYDDLKATLQKKSTVAGHDDELYDLMGMEERQRFIGFHEPQVAGNVTSGSVFTALFELIIGKQLQNLEYAFQVFRHSDGAVNIQAYFDKALDIRSMINAQLLSLDTRGRWSTRPQISGKQPSLVLGDTAQSLAKTCFSVESALREKLVKQPLSTLALQRTYLESIKADIADAFSVGLRTEAALRELSGTLRNADWHIVDTVFNQDRADRKSRLAVRGFHPDVFSLVLECAGEENVLPLDHCVVLTTRGGLDVQHSGRAILWTPANGWEVFESVGSARQQLNLRLLDSEKRLQLLENLGAAKRKFHRRYSLNSLRLIEGDVLQHIAQSAIDHFLAHCEQVHAWKLASVQQTKALQALTKTCIDANLRRAKNIADAIVFQQSSPAWFGMAPVEAQQLHAELLEQLHDSVPDNKDYLHGIKPLRTYVHDTLQTLLAKRFAGAALNPEDIEITPNLSLAGPAQSLTEFALNHASVMQNTGFRIASKSSKPLPANLDQAAIRQLLLSLDIETTYARQVTDSLVTDSVQAVPRWRRFVQQVPWQLLHHAHELKLQHRLSDGAFDLIRQVLDMPDAVARATVRGAHAIVRPLQLIKTAGAIPVVASGLYLIGPQTGQRGSQVLYAPYHTGAIFTEFDDEAAVAAAFNTPGPLQDLLLRRLAQAERSAFRNLYKSTAGQVSEITFGSNVIGGHLLTRLFNDNVTLLPHMLAARSESDGLSDWETVKQLFSSGIKLTAGLLPGKLSYGKFLWQAYDDFKASAEGLQDHHWTTALRNFISGVAQMVSLGRLSLEAKTETVVTSHRHAGRAPRGRTGLVAD